MLVQRVVLEKIAEQKGTKPKKAAQGPYWCGAHPSERPGVIKAPYGHMSQISLTQEYSTFGVACRYIR
jgi:mannose-6-phosphate isomerase class I